ncbi:protein unc-93 homolog A-like [Actinia tenebrosa]|uniref:Protein unc-93 homolog A-like n=1 Tax=Actinia tenebrosa TaxID=6105 RepID=A0A6P8ID87_ACTTE|nr:protein unc-93 homolog A-like [Actinia tenebrosa]
MAKQKADSSDEKDAEECLMTEKSVDEQDIETSTHDDPCSPEQPVTMTTKQKKREQCSILLNVFICSISFTLLFTAYISLQNLQSSLNSHKGLGLASLCVIYGLMMLSAIFVPPYMISRVGCKWTMVISMSGYFVYTAANYYSTWWTLIPASIIIGTCAAPLWSAKYSYLTTAALRYAKLTGEPEQAVMARYFGLASCFFTLAHITGNLISSVVLQKNTGSDVFRSDAHKVCGARYDQMPAVPSSNVTVPLFKPAHSLVINMLSVYLATSVLALLIVAVFLKRLKNTSSSSENRKSGMQAFMATIHQHKDRRLLLIIPLSVFIGVKSAFVFGDFSVAYVTCTIGIHRVGYVMMVFGATASIASVLVGRITIHTGIKPTIFMGSMIYTVSVLILLLWKPSASYVWVIYVLSVMLGLCDGLFETQIHAIYGHYFQDNKEPAFASFCLWSSFGFSMAFGYANFVSVGVKLCLLMTFLVIGMFGYLIAERIQNRNNKPLNVQAEEKPLQTVGQSRGVDDIEVITSI